MKEKGAESVCACSRSTALMIFSLGIMTALHQLLTVYKKNWRKIGSLFGRHERTLPNKKYRTIRNIVHHLSH
jgi:hypothetical protein